MKIKEIQKSRKVDDKVYIHYKIKKENKEWLQDNHIDIDKLIEEIKKEVK